MDRSPPAIGLSVIIPVYREEARINALRAHVAAIPVPADAGGVEILVVDGDPEGRTLAAMVLDSTQNRASDNALGNASGPPSGNASDDAPDDAPDDALGNASDNASDNPEGAAPPAAIILLASAQGRARQMNAGARAASGTVLLFLHADTRLPHDAFAHIAQALADPGLSGGAFALRIAPDEGEPGLGLRFIAWAANLRARLTRAPYGDQAIFLRREAFEALGGFPDLPLMEDLELMTRLRRCGRKIALLDAHVSTSARRWEREGLLRCTGRNLLLRGLYHLGVPAHRLAGFYPCGA